MSAKSSLANVDSLIQNAFDCAPDGMGLVDCEGRFLRVNPAFCQITGYSEAELRGRAFRDITHPDDRELDLQNMNKLLRGEVSNYEREKRYLHKDGSIVWCRLTVSLVRNDSGEALCLTGQVHNVTERKAEEEQLKGELIRKALQEGIGSDVFQSEAEIRLLKVIRALCQEQSLFRNKVSDAAFARVLNKPLGDSVVKEERPLTKREDEVLRLLAKNKTNKQVASALAISVRTVEVHRATAMRKLGAASLASLTDASYRKVQSTTRIPSVAVR